jgi:ribokinase
MPGSCVSVIGGLAVDLITVATRLPEQGETIKAVKYSKSLGGKGANSAVAIHRTSHVNPRNIAAAIEQNGQNGNGSLDEEIEVRMIGAVGDDEYGTWYTRELAENGVDVSGVRVVKGEMTGICTIIVEADFGENRILMTTAANETLLPSEFETLHSLANGPRPDLVVAQLEIPRETIEQVLLTASEHGVEVLLNPAPAYHLLTQTYKHIAHLIMNETEAAILSGRDVDEVSESTWADIADEFLMMGVTNVVITLGAKGAYFATAEGQKDHVPAVMVKVVDTTGAG